MVHPFERILSGGEAEKPSTPHASRRRVLKLAGGGAVAAVAARALGEITTYALGEEGGMPPVSDRDLIGPFPAPRELIAKYSRSFRIALNVGDVQTAAENFKKLENATKFSKSGSAHKNLVTGYRKQLEAALTARLKRADKDLADGKPVAAIKAYRMISRIDGFKQQDLAKSKLTKAAKLDGCDEALSEVQAQELYDTAAKAKAPDKLAIYEQVSKEYGSTPTGKKAAKQAKTLAGRLKRDEAVTSGLLEKARKAKGPAQRRALQTIVSRYPDTPSGKIAAEMLGARAPRPLPPRNGGPPVATTLAIGEEG